MDHALALRVITVEGVAGQARLENEERRWVFTPAHPWTRGPHAVRIDKTIEDMAGNRLHQLFDMDMNDPAQRKTPPPYDLLAFEVK